MEAHAEKKEGRRSWAAESMTAVADERAAANMTDVVVAVSDGRAATNMTDVVVAVADGRAAASMTDLVVAVPDVRAAGRSSTLPCAACKRLRRRCAPDCVFAPYFPGGDMQRFASVHKVFGASNVSKLIQAVPVEHRVDAANSLVYEANARTRDPIYGCVSDITALQRQVESLQTQLALAQAKMFRLRMAEACAAASLNGNGSSSSGGSPSSMSGCKPEPDRHNVVDQKTLMELEYGRFWSY